MIFRGMRSDTLYFKLIINGKVEICSNKNITVRKLSDSFPKSALQVVELALRDM